MRKTLFFIAALIVSIAQVASQSITIFKDFHAFDISPSGEWVFEVVEEDWVEPGAIFIYNTNTENANYYQASEMGDSPYVDGVSNNGLFVGSFKEKAATMDADGNWTMLSVPEGSTIGYARGISADGALICGHIEMGTDVVRVPVIWEEQQDGTFAYSILPYPEKDFINKTPKAVDALRISNDGEVVIGRIIDYAGLDVVIIWTKDGEGWKYEIAGEELLFNEGVEVPDFDTDSYPDNRPDPTDFFTEADWAAYNAAMEEYEEAIANDPDNWWLYDSPEHNQTDYITDPNMIDAYNKAVDEFNALAEAYNQGLEEYFDALNRLYKGGTLDVYYMNLKDKDGRYLTITYKEADDSDPESWWPTIFSYPSYYDLETKEWFVLKEEKDAIMLGVTNDGDLYYATPYQEITRNTFITPAGTNDIVDFADWLLDKTDGQIDLSDYFFYEYVDIDPVTWEEIIVQKTITGGVMFSADNKKIISTFYAPDGSDDIITYVVDLSDMTNVDEIKDASEQFAVYPNPVEDVLNIEGDFAKFTIVNLNGATVLSSTTNNVNVSELLTGVYLLNIELADGKTITKTMMKK